MLTKNKINKLKIDKNKKTIIFDFDGTLADTFEHLLDILDQYSGDFGVELANRELLEELRAMSARDVFKKFHIPFFLIPFIVRKVQKNLGKRIDKVYPFKEVVEAIKILKPNYNVGLLSTNSMENLDKFLEKENIKHLFDFVYSESNVFGKDKVLTKIIRKADLSRNDIVYVGDEARDVEAGNKAGIKVISVGWGFNSKTILEKINKDNYVEDTKGLEQKISETFKTSQP